MNLLQTFFEPFSLPANYKFNSGSLDDLSRRSWARMFPIFKGATWSERLQPGDFTNNWVSDSVALRSHRSNICHEFSGL